MAAGRALGRGRWAARGGRRRPPCAPDRAGRRRPGGRGCAGAGGRAPSGRRGGRRARLARSPVAGPVAALRSGDAPGPRSPRRVHVGRGDPAPAGLRRRGARGRRTRGRAAGHRPGRCAAGRARRHHVAGRAGRDVRARPRGRPGRCCGAGAARRLAVAPSSRRLGIGLRCDRAGRARSGDRLVAGAAVGHAGRAGRRRRAARRRRGAGRRPTRPRGSPARPRRRGDAVRRRRGRGARSRRWSGLARGVEPRARAQRSSGERRGGAALGRGASRSRGHGDSIGAR